MFRLRLARLDDIHERHPRVTWPSTRGTTGFSAGCGEARGLSTTPDQQPLAAASWVKWPRAFIAPLALAQFICSFAGSNMNVMINDISHDLHTDVKGVQT